MRSWWAVLGTRKYRSRTLLVRRGLARSRPRRNPPNTLVTFVPRTRPWRTWDPEDVHVLRSRVLPEGLVCLTTPTRSTGPALTLGSLGFLLPLFERLGAVHGVDELGECVAATFDVIQPAVAATRALEHQLGVARTVYFGSGPFVNPAFTLGYEMAELEDRVAAAEDAQADALETERLANQPAEVTRVIADVRTGTNMPPRNSGTSGVARALKRILT